MTPPHLVSLADGDKPCSAAPAAPDLPAFLASLSSASRVGEVRPTFDIEAKVRYRRSPPRITRPDPLAPSKPVALLCDPPTAPSKPGKPLQQRPKVTYAEPGKAKVSALTMVWPIVCRRLEGFPNINCLQLFEELCAQFPGRFTRWQYKRLARHVTVWRDDARNRGVLIGRRKQRRLTDNPRGRRRSPFEAHWAEMLQHLEAHPDQTALELLVEFQSRHPGRYSLRNLHTLQRRVRLWRREAVQRLICEMKDHTADVAAPQAVPA